MLLSINERKHWKDPSSLSPAQLELQDEEIFQTARLVKYVLSYPQPTQALMSFSPMQLRPFHVDDLRRLRRGLPRFGA